MKIADLRRDSKAINDGVWVDNIPGMSDLRLKVRGQMSKAFTEALAHRVASLTRDQRDHKGQPYLNFRTQCIAEAYADAVLLDWDNLTDEKGKPIKYTKELAMKWITDPDLRAFGDAVAWAAAFVDETRPKG